MFKTCVCFDSVFKLLGTIEQQFGLSMPYVVNDADFSKMMVEVEVSNKLAEKILKHIEYIDNWFYFWMILTVICIVFTLFEWRFPYLVKKWCYPPESDKTASLIANAV